MTKDHFQILNPDRYRFYFVFYALATLAGLIYLYWDFIFSDCLFNSYDMINAGIFFRSYLVKHLAAFGKIPVWNPYILCGLPYVDAIHGDIFYPLSFLKYFLPIYRAIGWTFILHIFLAGIFAWMAAREMNFPRIASGLIGTAYMFAPWLNSLVKPGHDSKIYVTALFPLLFFFIHRAFKKRSVLNYTMVGVVQGCILLSPHPQMAYFCFWAIAGYVVFNMLTHIPEENKIKFLASHTGLTTYAVVLALILGAIQFWPTYHYTRNYSPRILHQNNYNFAAGWSMHAEEAFSLLVPEFAGARIGYPGTAYWGRNGMKDNSEAAGLVITLLAIIGIVYSKRREKYFFAAMATGALIYALGDTTPIFHYLYDYVPYVKMTRAPSMIMFAFSFAVCLLGGMGIESLYRPGLDNVPLRYRFLKVMTMAAPALFLAGWYLFVNYGDEVLGLYAKVFYPALLGDQDLMQLAQNNLEAVRSGFLAAFATSAILSIIIWMTIKGRLGTTVILLLPVLVMADDIRFNQRFVQTQEPIKELSETPLIKYLQDNSGDQRVCGYGLDDLRLQLFYHGLSSPLGYHGNEPVWYYRLIHWGAGLRFNYINPRFADLVGVKYFLTPAGCDLSPLGRKEGDLSREAEFDGTVVIENRGCYPRTFLAGQYRLVADLDSICRLIYHGDDDLRKTVYLEREPPLAIDSAFSPMDKAEIDFYSSDSIVIRAVCSTAKISFLSDVYFKDWHVYVDGEEVEALRIDGAFRGVVIDAGDHTVVWKYIASDYKTGRLLTSCAMVWVLLILIVSFVHNRRSRRWSRSFRQETD